MECSDWIAIGSLIVALVALGFSLWGYFVYDRPIKQLQKQDLEQESLAKKQARLKIDYTQNEFRNSIFRVENVGRSDARNIVLKGISEEPVFYGRSITNNKEYVVGTLRPNDSAHVIRTCYRRQRLTMVVTWDDDSQIERTETFEVNYNG